MLLYHGTTKTIAQKALTEGLKPRGRRKGNWKHTVDSRRDAVYLTDIYGLYFAYCASKSDSNDTLAVIQVDTEKLNQNLFMPDEDFLEQASRGRTGEGFASVKQSMKQRTEYYRKVAEYNRNLWHKSIENLGTVSYQGVIIPEAITKIAYVDMDKQKDIIFSAADASICLMNHKFCSNKYKAVTEWLFGKSITAQEFMGFNFTEGMIPKEQINAINSMLKNRDGVEVYDRNRNGV
jgi:hypothetical protein